MLDDQLESTLIPHNAQASTSLAHTLFARYHPQLANWLEDAPLQQRISRNGEVLSHRNDFSQHVYLVTSGCFKRTVCDSFGDEHIAEFYFEGDLIGLDNIQGSSWITSVSAYDVGGTVAVPIRSLVAGQSEDARLSVFGELSAELDRARTLSLYVARKTAGARVAWFLHSLLERRNRRGISQQSGETLLPMPRCDIANYLGLAAETVSRELGALAKKGVVSVSNRELRVLDMPKLMERAEIHACEGPSVSPEMMH